jgi:hypothetical protein
MSNVLLIIGGVLLAAVVFGYLWFRNLKKKFARA